MNDSSGASGVRSRSAARSARPAEGVDELGRAARRQLEGHGVDGEVAAGQVGLDRVGEGHLRLAGVGGVRLGPVGGDLVDAAVLLGTDGAEAAGPGPRRRRPRPGRSASVASGRASVVKSMSRVERAAEDGVPHAPADQVQPVAGGREGSARGAVASRSGCSRSGTMVTTTVPAVASGLVWIRRAAATPSRLERDRRRAPTVGEGAKPSRPVAACAEMNIFWYIAAHSRPPAALPADGVELSPYSRRLDWTLSPGTVARPVVVPGRGTSHQDGHPDRPLPAGGVCKRPYIFCTFLANGSEGGRTAYRGDGQDGAEAGDAHAYQWYGRDGAGWAPQAGGENPAATGRRRDGTRTW